MAVVTVYQHGLKAGVRPSKTDAKKAKRSHVGGWSAKSTRSNLEFLRSVSLLGLTGLGHCFTLTVRDCPASSKQWAAMRKAYIMRLRRFGMFRLHWVTEWQRRKVPHLHGVVYFRDPGTDNGIYVSQREFIIKAWIEVAAEYSVSLLSQDVKAIHDEVGWLKYLAKHAARGADHYQRSADTMPEGWSGKSGRIWGHAGTWELVLPERTEMLQEDFWQLRRRVRAWRLADARASGVPARICSARNMLKCNKPSQAMVRGISEWLPKSDQELLLEWVRTHGFMVRGYFGRNTRPFS